MNEEPSKGSVVIRRLQNPVLCLGGWHPAIARGGCKLYIKQSYGIPCLPFYPRDGIPSALSSAERPMHNGVCLWAHKLHTHTPKHPPIRLSYYITCRCRFICEP